MEYSLKELLDIPKLRDLLDSLDELHSMPSAVIDIDGNILIATAWQDICEKFHRINPETEKKCIESDRSIESDLNQQMPQVIYRCPMGLVDAAMPIVVAGNHLGNVFTGQLFIDPPEEAYFANQARQYGFDVPEYLAAMKKVPYFTEETLRKNLNFIHRLTLMLAEEGLQNKLLRESEDRFRALHDASFGGVIIHEKGLILDCNQSLSEITGFSHDELIGMDGLKLIAPDSLDLVLNNIKNGYAEAYEVEGVRNDGSIYPLAIRGKNVTYQGREVRVIEFRDISEQKQAENALQESEKRFRELIEQSPIGLALCAMDGSLVSVNPAYAKILGYSIEETLRLTYWDITPKKYAPDEQRQLRQLEATGHYGPYEKEYRHKDGHLVPVRLNGMIVVRDGEKHIWSSVEDITVLKKAEADKNALMEQLRHSQKMEAIGTLAGGVAHDFNNILSAILGYTELTLRNPNCDTKSRKNLKHILSAAERARELVKQILMYSRKGEKNLELVELHSVVLEAIRLLRKTIPTTVSIRLDIDPGTGTVRGDSTQIHQVVMNLCTNAYHSLSEQSGEIAIKLDQVDVDAVTAAKYPNLRQGRYGQLTVSDNGSGMPPKIMTRIFDPFFTTKKQGEGTGMGLAVTHGIVQSHDGAIGVESAVGDGTTFNVFFPLSSEIPNGKKTSYDASVNQPGSEHILLVDDEAMLVDLGKETLESLGYRVTATTSANEALELFQANPDNYDLIVTDQTMPEMSGDVLAQKAMLIRTDLPVLICTGHSAVLNAEKAQAIGVKALLMKPLNSKELNSEIRKILESPIDGQ
ncbi:PAS domain S-box-containing protein [Malonomonas rubra DSM 5091]|uniref:histidine kinase n=1 Tax=Malonomonas rubra DSM 5091 TaxID=1122189 RepID=A0A1M6KTD3_MALRU|nr:PocR ligand-binding domain-containing protein [Malonomonas rubra]SHJ62228.1 PAS domain S-box-containing protein [Malonomonas rubra DSM 5091]